MAVKFSNNAATTLASGMSGGATSFTVASNTGFPTLGGSDWTYVTIDSEVVKVTAISGTTFTCDATSEAHSISDNVELRMTAELLDDFAEDLDVYTHPTSDGNKHVPSGGSSGQFLKYSSAGTATWAADNDTVYTHPTSDGNKHVPSGGSSGQFLKYSSAGTATWAADNDTVYTHPSSDGNKHVPSGGSSGQFLKYSSAGTATWAADNDTVYTHPSSDGDLHVPATSTSNDGKLLTAGATAGAISWEDAPVSLPTQTSHSGKYLTTDGSDASWSTVSSNSTSYGLYEHAHTISADYTISSSNNALSASPITIDTGYSVTVSSGSTWVIV